MGIVSVGIFGGMLIYVTDERPVLRLRPALEKHLGVEELVTRFVAGQRGARPHVVVELPPAGFDEEAKRRSIAAFALEEYHRLAENKTLVDRCVVVVRDRQDLPAVEVSTQQILQVIEARRSKGGLERILQGQGLRDAAVTVKGLAQEGAHLQVVGRARNEGEAKRILRRVSTNLRVLRYAGLVEVTIRHRDGEVQQVHRKEEGALPGGVRRSAPPPQRAPAPEQEPPRGAGEGPRSQGDTEGREPPG
jgi:hypothetical protein